MAQLKTAKNAASVTKFLNAIEDPQQKKDSKAIHAMMREATGARASMWGDSIVGYGTRQLKYASGRELDWFVTGFSPRKQSLSLYVLAGLPENEPLLKKLGKHKRGKGCLYVKRLDDIDVDVLRKLIAKAVKR